MRAPLALIAALASGGCFYLDPVNGRPSAQVEQVDPAVVYQGSLVLVSARRSSDPDNDPLRYEWQILECDDVDHCDQPPAHESAGIDCTFEAPSKRLLLVVLKVTDSYGAWDMTDLAIVPVNRATDDLDLQVRDERNGTGPFTVGQELAALAVASDPDGDELTWQWDLYPPTPSEPTARVWAPVTDRRYRLVPDVAGEWQIRVTVSDEDPTQPGTDTVLRTVVVNPDGLPCIVATTPAAGGDVRYVIERAAGSRRLSVDSVEDDLDPFPAGSPSFRWYATDPASGSLAALPGHDVNDLFLDPAAYGPGAAVEVRVEIADRTGRWPDCPAAEPSCSRLDDGCVQRLTWNLEVR